MIHPSYKDLMNVMNSNVEPGEEPVVNSRYSIVLAAAKRAKQIINGAPPEVKVKCDKPLSIAVDELNAGKVRILTGNEAEELEDITEGYIDEYDDYLDDADVEDDVEFVEEDEESGDIDFADDISADAEEMLTE